MTEGAKDPIQQIKAAREAFEREFERFARFIGPSASEILLNLAEAESQQRDLAELRTRHIGKKSAIAAGKKMIGRVSPEERASFGQLVQQTESSITQSLEQAEQTLKTIIEAARTARESIDVTIPGHRPRPGHLHPITLMRQRIEDIFVSLGYAVEDDREIETDFYNFDALNIPEGHPAGYARPDTQSNVLPGGRALRGSRYHDGALERHTGRICASPVRCGNKD